jgi:hypothetical protein
MDGAFLLRKDREGRRGVDLLAAEKREVGAWKIETHINRPVFDAVDGVSCDFLGFEQPGTLTDALALDGFVCHLPFVHGCVHIGRIHHRAIDAVGS